MTDDSLSEKCKELQIRHTRLDIDAAVALHGFYGISHCFVKRPSRLGIHSRLLTGEPGSYSVAR
jgi:hypothetical protein